MSLAAVWLRYIRASSLARVWRRLCKAGVLPARYEPQLAKWSAYAELVGYIGSVTVKVLAVQALDKHIASFEETMSHVSMVRSQLQLALVLCTRPGTWTVSTRPGCHLAYTTAL